jgi:subtilisin-like proprotein convertase family protein
MKRCFWITLCALALLAAWWLWPSSGRRLPAVKHSAGASASAPAAATAGTNQVPATAGTHPATRTNRLAFRLTNTRKTIGELTKMPHAILLENALIDTDGKVDLKIPAPLRAKGDPGAYIVQARGPIDAAFRALLASAGAQIVSYIPNNAYLVRVSAAGAGMLAGSAPVQAVLPFEPYYKLQPSLLGLAVEQQPLPPGTALNVGLFAADAAATEQQLENLGFKIMGMDRSPFGPVLHLLAPADWTPLAQVPGVQVLELSSQRVLANDLSRATLGVSADSQTTTNWLDLTGSNVMVQVNDSSVDASHPDLTNRVFGAPADLTDYNGHGTHVAGTIAGNGTESTTVSNAEGSPFPYVTNQFRGMAPEATLFSINYNNSDYILQTTAAATNALISNNSWVYGGDYDYDLAAASYDAATRDALPFTSGSQPVLFVFAAGDRGGGNDNGAGGSADTIQSPGTAKNVITVGALEQPRGITNVVTTVIDGVTNTGTPWFLQTDSSSQVAGYSARGNVGVGTEGAYGRFKPDVVTPGTFVVSTRSGQWDTNAYFNPTNVSATPYTGQLVVTNGFNYYSVLVPPNAVAVTIIITTNNLSPNPFPTNLPIYVAQTGVPGPGNGLSTTQDSFSIPGDQGTAISTYQNNGFYFAVGNNTNFPVNYDVTVAIYTTNNVVSDYYQVLFGMDDQLGPYYRYESGTSMAAADVSGALALIEDYFTNTMHLTPSPALLKAMLINGARSEGGYLLAITNGVNFQGWGLPSLPNSLPLTNISQTINALNGSASPLFFVDQSPTNALATGDSHTYTVTIDPNPNDYANYLQLQATLVWTDPPGDPAAAIKLVNSLELVITNLDDPSQVYYGNDIAPDLGYNLPAGTNAPNVDMINNVQNILLPPLLAGSYSVTVIGRSVNVNAVTAQGTNVVQDYALVVSVGEGEVPTAISSVTNQPIASNPTGDQDITFVATTNAPLMNQRVGANTPFQGTNTLALGTNTGWGGNGQLTVGMTNQWHFYVVTNNAGPNTTNAAFITFDAYNLSVPRMGVYEDSVANATRPQADIDLYVSINPGLTNLDPNVISNCLAASVNGTGKGSGASLSQGGTEFVYFTDSTPGQIYYVGVKSEDQMASEYGFIPIFTATPFSQLNPNGDLVVNGLLLPAAIPDGDNAQPGVVTVFALAVPLMGNVQVADVTVTNWNQHQNFGDLFGALTFGSTSVVLNNHDGLGNTFGAGTGPLVYDDSPEALAGAQPSDGPGSLMNYQGQSAIGPWILTEMDNALGMTGQVSQLTLVIQPRRDLGGSGITNAIPPNGWFIDYVDVPPGYTNLTFFATNLPPTISPPLEMFEKLGSEPTLTDYDQEADLTNTLPGTGLYPLGTDPGNSISVGPPLNQGRYFIGIYNPSPTVTANVFLSATLGLSSTASTTYDYANTNGATTLPPDAVTNVTGIFVSATQAIASVNVGMYVTSPQISDYTFTLVSPTGQRILLMENRGGSDPNGAGTNFVYTNVLNTTATGNATPKTNYLAVMPGEVVPIIYNFYTVPDEMTVYAGTNNFDTNNGAVLLLDTGFFSNGPPGNTPSVTTNVTVPAGYTNITIIMNQFGNTNGTGGDAWDYTAGAAITNFEYLTFTDDTNLANVPIKFAIPPYNFTESEFSTNFDFESAINGDYFGPTNIPDTFGGWTVPTNIVTVSTVFNLTNSQFVQVTNVTVLTNNLVSVVTDPADSLGGDTASGSNLLALADGTITRVISNTVPGHLYNVTFWFRGPGIASWWRGEGNASDSSDPENNGNNGALVGRFNFPAGEVGQCFEFEDPGSEFDFAGTNTYVQVPQDPSLDVGQAGGFTVEGWINPTNLAQPQPLVEWLAQVPTNSAVTNLVIKAGPYLDPATGHYYYLLGATNWTVSELWAESLGGHLATIDTANEQNWVFDNFANFGGRNRNLWIGLTNNLATTFGWIDGTTNVAYTNWLSSQPTNCDGTRNYTFMFGGTNPPAGLWTLADTNGFVCGSTATNIVYGVAEVDDLQTNGVQFWISATNTPGTTNAGFFSGTASTNGCLYADIVDTNFVAHEIYSAPGLIQSNVFQHVALTFDTNSGLARLYLNGTNVATTNLFLTTGVFTPFVPKTDGDVLLGRDMSRFTNNYYAGEMDEMSIYRRALSDAEILGIYRVSATATNGLTGKFDPTVTPAYGLAEAEVTFGTTSNLIFGVNNRWEMDSYTFTAASNSMPLQITGLQPGILLDNFAVSEAPLTNLYYLPEQSLSSLVGGSAYGNWTLQVWDNLAGAYITNLSQLVSWQLSFVLNSNATFAASLDPQTPTSATVGPGQTVYFSVAVPSWAKSATNILVSSSQPVNLLFNPTNLPTGSDPGDITLLSGQQAGVSAPVTVNVTPPPYAPYQAGQSYVLGVQNNTTHAASVVLEVDYDITPLTNGVPCSSYLTNTDSVRYFSYTVSSNAYEATFQLLKLSGNADLVVRKGVPLPTLTNSDYGSFNAGRVDENIYVLTNSSPVPLSAGTWYLGVVKRDSGVVNYTVLAKELDVTNSVTNSISIIDLTNGVPFDWNAGPGAALTNFFRLSLANNPALTNAPGLRFELYNLTGNGDLTVQTNTPPLAPPFFQSSQNTRRTPELILVFTNSALTNLAADWYLGVPNNETTNISYTILAEIDTNSYFPAFPGATGAGGGAVGAGHMWVTNGTVYHVTTNGDAIPAIPGSLRDAVNATNRTVVFDISDTINLASPLVITNSYLTIAGQTAPGGGITVAGQMTTLTNVHDVIIRDIRFRSAYLAPGQNLFVADSGSDNIYKFTPDGTRTTFATGLNYPDGIAFNSAGNLFEEDGFSGNIYEFTPDGTRTTFATGLNDPEGLAFDSAGNLFVSNHGNQSGTTITKITPGGTETTFATGLNAPYALAFDSAGDLFEADNGSGNINKFINTNGTLSSTPIVFASGLNDIYGLAFNSAGNLFCLSRAGGDIYEFTPNGTQSIFANGPIGGNQLAFDNVGNLYEADGSDGEDAIVKFTPNGTQSIYASPFANAVGLAFSAPMLPLIEAGSGADSLQFLNASNVVADHVSAEWSSNNDLSTLNSSNVTVQWSILADSLYSTNSNATNPPTGSLLRYGSGALSFNHNLYADNYSGSPQLGDNLSLDFVNNVIYNWGTNAGFSTNDLVADPNGFTNQLNYVCNYLIAGTNSLMTNIAFWGGSTNTWIFQTNNFIDSDTNGVLNGADTQWLMFTNQYTKFGHPFPLVQVPTDEAYLAYEKVLDFAGPDMALRDTVDTNIVAKVRTQTGTLIASAGTLPLLNSSLPYLDTDQDGIPDFWEITFGQPQYVPSNNQFSTNANYIGYTTLEEYNAWLAGPHALTVTNAPVGVDLMQLFGNTGNLSFSVTNGVNGTVYLTNVLNYTNVSGIVITETNTGTYSNSFAIFTPTNNFSGYASFDAFVTNNDTIAYFGPVTVSVVVSAVPVAINSNMPPVITPLTIGQLDPTNYGGSDFYKFTVTTNSFGSNAVAVLFTVTNASGPVDLLANYGLPLPSLSSYEYISTNSWTTTENILVTSNSTPVALTNGDWYLAVVNVAGSNVTYDIEATTLYNVSPPIFYSPTNGDVFTNIETTLFTTNCVATDPNTPALPLTYAIVTNVSQPNLSGGPDDTNVMTIDPNTGVISWTPDEAQGPTTNSVAVSVSNGAFSVTNSFTIIVEESNLPPYFVITNFPNQVIIGTNTLVVTNTARDPDIPTNPLTYTLLVAPTNAVIDTNSGVITWTPTLAQAGTNYLFTTIVTDTNPWAVNSKSLSATNSFYVTVLPPLPPGPPLTNTVPTGGINWLAVSVPTNAIAATNILLYATNLPVNVWFSTNVPPSIANGFDLLPNTTNDFSVLTTNSSPTNIVPGGIYFLGVENTNSVSVGYALEVNFLLAAPSGGTSIFISSIIYTNGGFLLTWFAPTNDVFQVQWENQLVPANWQFFTNFVYYTGPLTLTNGLFSFFDDGSQTPPGRPPIRFYRIVLVGTIPSTLTNAVSISGLTASNTAGTNAVSLAWLASTNDLFEVHWTTNLVPPVNWSLFPAIVTSTNGQFSFTDTNAPLIMKFYELILLP